MQYFHDTIIFLFLFFCEEDILSVCELKLLNGDLYDTLTFQTTL